MEHMLGTDIAAICRDHPQILVFLSLAIGYFVGKIKLFGFSLGSTASVLLAALVLGQIEVNITPLIKTISFALFIFTIGYKVGPQFFGGLKKEGISYIIISLFFAIVGLVTAILLGKLFGFDKGTTVGLVSGALTQSTVIGAADDAISSLAVSAAEKTALEANVAVAYAISYIFGVAGLIIFYKIVPRLFKMNLVKEAQQLEAQFDGDTQPPSKDVFAWNRYPTVRIYQVTNKTIEGKTVSSLPVTIAQINRDGKLLAPTKQTKLKHNDHILVVGSRDTIIELESSLGPEIDDQALSSIAPEVIDVWVSKKQAEGKTIAQLMKKYGTNCYIHSIERQGHTLPLKPKLIVHKGDILQIVGLQQDVDIFVKKVGYAERATTKSNIIMVGLGCFLGTLLGIVAVKFGVVTLSIGVGASVLLAGLLLGWLRSVRPMFGGIPAAAQWLLIDLGLNLFIACVGLTAGPKAIDALKSHGIWLFLAGVLLTLIPHILSLLFGHFVLRMNPVLLLGAVTGSGTATPSLNVLKDECKSAAPALGYTVPYAIGNFILTLWGTIIINFM